MDGLPGDILRLLDVVGEEGHPLDHHLLTGEQVVHVHHQAIQDYVTVTRRRKVCKHIKLRILQILEMMTI